MYESFYCALLYWHINISQRIETTLMMMHHLQTYVDSKYDSLTNKHESKAKIRHEK